VESSPSVVTTCSPSDVNKGANQIASLRAKIDYQSSATSSPRAGGRNGYRTRITEMQALLMTYAMNTPDNLKSLHLLKNNVADMSDDFDGEVVASAEKIDRCAPDKESFLQEVQGIGYMITTLLSEVVERYEQCKKELGK
jgi:hypothetical protein